MADIQDTVAIMVIAINVIVVVMMLIHAILCFVIEIQWRARMKSDHANLKMRLRETLAYEVYEQFVNPNKRIGRTPMLLTGLVTTISSTMVIAVVAVLICTAVANAVMRFKAASVSNDSGDSDDDDGGKAGSKGADGDGAAAPAGDAAADGNGDAPGDAPGDGDGNGDGTEKKSMWDSVKSKFKRKDSSAAAAPGAAAAAAPAAASAPAGPKKGGFGLPFGFSMPFFSSGTGTSGEDGAAPVMPMLPYQEETLAERILGEIIKPPAVAMLTTCLVLIWIVSIQKFADDERLRANCERAMKAVRDNLLAYGEAVAKSYEESSMSEKVIASLRTNDHNTVREMIAAAHKSGSGDDASMAHASVLLAVYLHYANAGGATILTETNLMSPVDRGVAAARHFADFPLNLVYSERKIPKISSAPPHVVEFLSQDALRIVETRLAAIEKCRMQFVESLETMMQEHLTMYRTLGTWSAVTVCIPALLGIGVKVMFM